MNIACAVANVLVTKKALNEFKEVIEEETGMEVTDPMKLLQACLQYDARNPAQYAFMVADSGILKMKKMAGIRKKRK